MRTVFLVVALTVISTGVVLAQKAADTNGFPTLFGPYLGQTPPELESQRFAEGIIPIENIEHCFPTFSPDGREAYWMTMKRGEKPRIMFMQEEDGTWTPPKVASFSGEYSDQAPVFSPDGHRLYFVSNRPGGFGKADIWYVEQLDTLWSEPINLGSPPNSPESETQPSLTTDGTIYFVSQMDGVEWGRGIYRSRLVNDRYTPREALSKVINTEHADAYPFISPDESYLLFGSSRPGGRSAETDLYVSFLSEDGSFSEPRPFGETINNGSTVSFATVTAQGEYLFFNRFIESGTDAFFWVSGDIIDSLRQQQ